MSQARNQMSAALRRVAVPVLRELGFKGSFPHFRRTGEERIDLLTFQFCQWDGQFVVEVGSFPANGIALAGKHIPPAEVRMRHLLHRLRLGASDEDNDHWFVFDGGNYDEVAATVIPYIRGQAIEWWSRVGLLRRKRNPDAPNHRGKSLRPRQQY